MPIHVTNHTTFDGQPPALTIIISDSSLVRFKQLFSRALNTFDQAHPELKELGDMLEHGRILQDYYAQQHIIRSPDE